MEEEVRETRSSQTARVTERVLRRLLEHPYGFSYAALAISCAITLARGFDSLPSAVPMLIGAAAFAAWLPLWARQHTRDPKGRTVTTSVLALTGILLLAPLAAIHVSFVIVGATLVAQYFAMLPFPVALLAFMPMAFAAEYSHWVAVLADPTAFPWNLAVIRGIMIAVLGIALRALAFQIDERTRLQASVAAAERRAGMLEERQRLAREIHDTLAQGFAGIAVHLERAEQLESLSGSPARPHLELARSVAREGLEDARRMLGALRPEILTQRALPEALSRVCEEWSRRTGVTANLSITGAASPMHPDIELTILRGVQEALTNVARHSGAHSATVTLSYMEDLLVLDVQDDGKGFVPMSIPGRGYGITGMRERTESLDGSFSVESVPGEGTTISISLPVLRPAGSEPPTEGVAS